MSTKKESVSRTIIVALLVCLVCSIVVSVAAVSLKPVQVKNQLLDKQRNILLIAGLLEEGPSVAEQFEQVTARLVDLRTGKFSDAHEPLSYDQQAASRDPNLSRALEAHEDVASIRRREHYATVYMIENEDGIETMILPIHGYGLWSTLYGFLALEGDLNTIRGLGFYQHGETPGLGGEVDNPRWRELWKGNVVYNEEGEVGVQVVKGTVDGSDPRRQYKVDGLAGATLTSRGVENLVRFWMGDTGFRSFLQNLKAGEA
ncbi:Na(+)-translocating NADH-quinone reductase subunit C [Pseudomonas sp. gcc21]|uniref:Na(+)-translocating NADH-quinone reductase subunit C n=1 Tax=Pseudomonas sp. gcc21 TaxID=2726989 RepID=UPI0014522D11|nr:Na(+)-translocating NADH-quinone reductase subunit C [Pseudomonas sp. gcc21]QJD58510.1 Na(+)-translocating NADH-quinone reductase subunit C [Pseudomonas sp. gcc21]